ncbi:enoyl-CoA hydratase/isomerase family protein [Umezawaea endophytica]|uniref:3-hydroxyisobutyryl-CoA hydrolase n=1 Tax=Umezawaea endophytica TaxID=1654476 RepID=A0A9X2VFE0_9PSEU|nr:enoyl-CoA hydratase/isomerase family protein [Umezawaea endophytica]MCS7475459.1 enoyl-CoA hydratase/isomerase family protein [Umezawaea endophytica]
MEPDDVLLRRERGLGRVVLNRPKAINALTHAVVERIDAALTDWAADDDVRAVVISGAGERGLCAGGDLRGFHADAVSGGTGTLDFWRDEYALDAHVARYPKPYVAIMDGIVMGGGVGVSAHGGVRVVTERTRLAMPEVGIGLVPDVGGTYLLTRAPGELGTHLALTATAIGAGDAIACGFADHFVPSDRLPDFLDALAVDVDDAVRAFSLPAPPADLPGEREWIDRCYAADSVEEVVANLLDLGSPDAKDAAERILGKSPTALKVTLESLRRARELETVEQALVQEYRVSTACLRTPDLAEGIRAQVIDKDRAPRWTPSTLEEVTDAAVEDFFAPLGDRELVLPPRATRGT